MRTRPYYNRIAEVAVLFSVTYLRMEGNAGPIGYYCTGRISVLSDGIFDAEPAFDRPNRLKGSELDNRPRTCHAKAMAYIFYGIATG